MGGKIRINTGRHSPNIEWDIPPEGSVSTCRFGEKSGNLSDMKGAEATAMLQAHQPDMLRQVQQRDLMSGRATCDYALACKHPRGPGIKPSWHTSQTNECKHEPAQRGS